MTISVLPSTSLPLSAEMAACPACPLSISTKPKPLDRPLSRSLITCAERTLPYGKKAFPGRCRGVSPNRFGERQSGVPLSVVGERQTHRPVAGRSGKRAKTRSIDWHYGSRANYPRIIRNLNNDSELASDIYTVTCPWRSTRPWRIPGPIGRKIRILRPSALGRLLQAVLLVCRPSGKWWL